jgi:hypothetical protein
MEDSINGGIPKKGWDIEEKLVITDDFGVPPFLDTSMPYIYKYT